MSDPTGAPDLFGDVDDPEWGPDVYWIRWVPVMDLPGIDYRPVGLPGMEWLSPPEARP
jgi:hypothetical protein